MRLWLRSSSVLLQQLAAATASRWIQMETPRAPSTTWSRSSPNLTRPDRPTTTVVSDTHYFLLYSDTPRLDSWLLGHRPVCPTGSRVKRSKAKPPFPLRQDLSFVLGLAQNKTLLFIFCGLKCSYRRLFSQFLPSSLLKKFRGFPLLMLLSENSKLKLSW